MKGKKVVKFLSQGFILFLLSLLVTSIIIPYIQRQQTQREIIFDFISKANQLYLYAEDITLIQERGITSFNQIVDTLELYNQYSNEFEKELFDSEAYLQYVLRNRRYNNIYKDSFADLRTVKRELSKSLNDISIELGNVSMRHNQDGTYTLNRKELQENIDIKERTDTSKAILNEYGKAIRSIWEPR